MPQEKFEQYKFNYKFDDVELDTMTRYNWIYRAALIERQITKIEYLALEKSYWDLIDLRGKLSLESQKFMKEALVSL